MFARNLILPGVRDSSSQSSYDDPSPGHTFSKADCEAFYTGFPEIECAGTGAPGETASQRFAAAFPDLDNPRDPAGRGADIDGLRQVVSEIRDPAWSVSESTGTVRFEAPAEGPCLVDVSDDPAFEVFERVPAEGADQRSASFEGLGAGTAYYRIKCAAQTKLGRIEAGR